MNRHSPPAFIPIFCLVALSIVLSFSTASQVIHENPDAITTTVVTPIDAQISSLVSRMASDIETISSHIHEKNYSAARETYGKFSHDGGNLRDLILQFNVSAEDTPALEADLDFMQADLNDILQNAEQYNRSLYLYNASLASGDSANASLYSGRLRETYVSLGLAYNKLYNNATSAGDLLGEMGIDTGQYASAIDDLNEQINRLADAYDETLPGEREPSLLLSTYRGEVQGDNNTSFKAVLSDGNTTALPGGTASANDRNPAGISGEPMPHSVSVSDVPAGQAADSNDAMLISGLAPTMDVDRSNASFGDVVSIFGALRDANGKPMGGKPIDILVNGNTTGRAATLDDGSYAYALSIRPDFPAGQCMVNSAYQAGSDVLMSAGKSLNITQVNAVLTLDAPAQINNVTNLDVNGTLVSSNGVPVSGANISIFVDNALAANALTNDSGFYGQSIRIPENILAGGHFIVASFDPGDGKAIRAASSGHLNFTTSRGSPVDGTGGQALNYIALLVTGIAAIAVILLVIRRLSRRIPMPPVQAHDALPVPEPASKALVRPEEPGLKTDMAPIMADIESKNYRKAQRGIYFLAIKAALFEGMAIRDSMTPREVQKATSSAFPEIFQPLSMIARSYEKAAFAPEDIGQAEVLCSIDCMAEIFKALGIGISEAQ